MGGLSLILASVLSGHPGPSVPADVAAGRYARLASRPTLEQLDPLAVRVTVRIPAPVTVAGEAAQYLLGGSGYSLVELPGSDALLRLPLPDVHRQLGPMSLTDALGVLGRPAYRLVVDHRSRRVAYELHPQFDPEQGSQP